MIRVAGRTAAYYLLMSGLAFSLACASSTEAEAPTNTAVPASAAADELVVANAWIDLADEEFELPAYFVIQNRGQTSRALVAARSTLCDHVSIRRVVVEEGMWSSTELPSLDVPAGGAVAFVPRGLFLQLDCSDRLVGATSVPITLEFTGGGSLSFDAELRAP